MECCAECGKADVRLEACQACKLVKYCNVNCQVAHRLKHKKACRIRAAQLFDKRLFSEPPPREDCPICMLILPLLPDEWAYMTCCGKTICSGCSIACIDNIAPSAIQPYFKMKKKNGRKT